MVERPKLQQKPARPQPQKQSKESKPKSKPSTGGGSGGRNNNFPKRSFGGGDDKNSEPSPWLKPDAKPRPHATASFVEYLRWMREAEGNHKDATKVQILQMATQSANYRNRLSQLTRRTQLIATDSFEVKCPWRIRVGGHRGPESILLPAFDALGMPYIPSSTLRGVARTQAIREIMTNDNVDWSEAEKQIAPYFGSLEAEGRDRAGKVIFLDAYPLPSKNGGLEMDMANNIWTWKEDNWEYDPNPNPFLSLKEPTFLIGLRLATNCDDPKILNRVKEWLIAGLEVGVGSQVNTGYGELVTGKIKNPHEFFRLEFGLEGQLIHGYQKFIPWRWNEDKNQWQMRGQAEPEVRPPAFKSMLRYWFRAFALGVLTKEEVLAWEGQLFGAIQPTQKQGWLKARIYQGKLIQKEPRSNHQGKNDQCGEQEGILSLSFSSEAPSDPAQQKAIKTLSENLTWLMVNLGGIGQGARRPCYSRRNRNRAPWYRGSTFLPDPEDDFWTVSSSVQGFQKQFQERLKEFYQSLARLTGKSLNYNSRREVAQVSQDSWIDAVDYNCEIIVCAGSSDNNKPYALSILHSPNLKVKKGKYLDYDGDLCGQVRGEVKASPVWIADLGDYQVVTVFGATEDPRQKYIAELRDQTTSDNFAKIFPLP